MSDQCVGCRAPFEDPETFRCPVCNLVQPSVQESELEIPALSEVEASDIDRIDIGEFGYSWGGGIALTSVTLMGGSPGAGKSTLMLQLAGLVIAQSDEIKPILYIHSEEEPGQIKGRADRLKIPGLEHIRMFSAFGGDADIVDALMQIDPCFCILDSLSGIAGEDAEKALDICKTLKMFASNSGCPAIIIDHITKEDAFAGRMTLQHTVDTLITFYPDETKNDIRKLKTIKNRFGPAIIEQTLTMTEYGLKIVKKKIHKPKDDGGQVA